MSHAQSVIVLNQHVVSSTALTVLYVEYRYSGRYWSTCTVLWSTCPVLWARPVPSQPWVFWAPVSVLCAGERSPGERRGQRCILGVSGVLTEAVCAKAALASELALCLRRINKTGLGLTLTLTLTLTRSELITVWQKHRLFWALTFDHLTSGWPQGDLRVTSERL